MDQPALDPKATDNFQQSLLREKNVKFKFPFPILNLKFNKRGNVRII